VLVLLAMAFFPVAAEASSTGSVYEPEVPTVPSEKPPKKNNSIDDPQAGKSNDGGGPTAPDTTPEEGEEVENAGGTGGDQGSGSGGGGGKSGNDGGTGQGNPGNGSNDGQKLAVGEGTQVPGATTQPADDGDSSSPLVPILIAVAVLAAISVGAVVVRNRRQGGGSDAGVSPKAS
jgi:hypothetical protein